jgi:AP-3 complex subunit mu
VKLLLNAIGEAESVVKSVKSFTAKWKSVIHVFKFGIFFVGVTSEEAPPLMIVELLTRMIDIFKSYCKKITEDTIKQNFVTIYQLLDEMLDYGFPITTEPGMLSDLVKPPPGEFTHTKNTEPTFGEITTNVEWRKPGIRYSQNELYVDVVEELSCTIDVNGMVVSSEINGKVNCNCRLSGMPDLAFYLKDPSIIEDCSFHPCVRYARFEQDKVISFIPPDGQFELMTYRISNIPLPQIYIRPQITWTQGGANIQIMANSKSTEGNQLDEVQIIVPLPKNAIGSKVTTNHGSVAFNPTTKELVWSVGKFDNKSHKTPSMSGNIQLDSNQKTPDTTPAVLVKFKLPLIAYSNMKVDQVVIKNETYKPFKGVRYVTIAGKYQIRTC